MTIKEQQELIISSIKEELSTEKTLRYLYLTAVYLDPSNARFLFNDMYVKYEVIEPLINNGTLKYKGIKSHQGIKMYKYSL